MGDAGYARESFDLGDLCVEASCLDPCERHHRCSAYGRGDGGQGRFGFRGQGRWFKDLWRVEMMNGSKPCGRACEPGFRSIPEVAGSRRPWRSLIQRVLSVLFIALLSSSALLWPARA